MSLRNLRAGSFTPRNPEQTFFNRGYTASSRIDNHMLQVGLGDAEENFNELEAVEPRKDSAVIAETINEEITNHIDDFIDGSDDYADYLTTHGNVLGDSRETVADWQKLSNEYLHRLSTISKEDYAHLPQDTKDVLQLMNRCKQMIHMQGGSTVYDKVGAIYSEAETKEYIDDFCSAFEQGLQANGITLQLERPEGIGAINQLSNLVLLTAEVLRLDIDELNSGNAVANALRQAVKPFIAKPRQRLAAAGHKPLPQREDEGQTVSYEKSE